MALQAGNVTIKLAAGDYSTWKLFWDDLGNLTGDITCTVDASAFTEAAAPAAVTESLNNHNITVTPASFPTKTDASDGARFTCNYTGNFIYFQMEGWGTVTIEGIVGIEGSSKPAKFFELYAIEAALAFVLRRCIVKGGGYGLRYNDTTVQSIQIYNNIFYNQDYAMAIVYAASSGIFANNTVSDVTASGISAYDKVNTYENNLIYNSGYTDYFQIDTGAIGNNNADSDATAENADWGGGGANNVNNIGDPFNNLGADDFTITAEGVIGDDGKDLSGDFTTDFFGTTRDNWTIGACEYVAAQDITVGAEATLEAEIDVDIALQVPIETTVEAEIEGDKALTTPIEAMVEAEVEVGTTMAITIPIEATVEAELSTSSRITTPIEATVEPEVEVNTSLTTPIEATVEAEIDIDLALQVNVEATVEAELEATKAIQTPIEATVEAEISSGNRTGKWMVIDAEMDFSGATSGQNPNWLLIPDYLNWMGEWNALTSYDDRDVVLYVTDDGEYHGFVSKSNHNVGNIPTTSYQHWTRLIQGVWNK